MTPRLQSWPVGYMEVPSIDQGIRVWEGKEDQETKFF